MYQTKKDSGILEWRHILAWAGFGMVYAVEATAANVHDVDIDEKLILQNGAIVYGDSGYLDLPNRPEL